MENILTREMWKNQQYIDATKEGLEVIRHERNEDLNQDQFTYYWITYTYSALSAYEAKLFVDACEIFRALFKFIDPWKYELPCDQIYYIVLLEHYLESLLYCYFNGETYLETTINAVVDIIIHRSKVNFKETSSSFESSMKLINASKNGKYPYYTYTVKLPYALPISNDDYKIQAIENVENIKVHRYHVPDLTAIDGTRFFSKVIIRLRGFAPTDAYWLGDSVNNYGQDFSVSNKIVRVLNEFITYISQYGNPIFLSYISDIQIGNITVNQYDGEDELYHFSHAMRFSGNTMVDAINHIKNIDNEVEMKKRLSLDNPLELYIKLENMGRLQRKNGLYVESFMILNSAVESLIEISVRELARLKGKEAKYEDFIMPKSICLGCEFIEGSTIEESSLKPGPAPSIFQYPKFLKDIEAITGKEARKLTRLFSKIRNDKTRNKLMHGKISNVDIRVVDETIEYLEELKCLFEELLLKARNKIT